MNIWDERYSSEEYIYGTEPNEFFREELLKIPPGKILLPAEGEGRNAVFAAINNWEVVAVDSSNEGKNKAQKLAMKNNVLIDYRVKDLTDFAINEEPFDAVALIYVHLPKEIRKNIHHKLIKSLKKGGFIIFEAFSSEQIIYTSGGPKTLELLYNQEMILDDFKSLNFKYFEQTTTQLSEGEYHKGFAHVIRFVGVI